MKLEDVVRNGNIGTKMKAYNGCPKYLANVYDRSKDKVYDKVYKYCNGKSCRGCKSRDSKHAIKFIYEMEE